MTSTPAAKRWASPFSVPVILFVISVAVGSRIAAGRWPVALTLCVLVAVPAISSAVPAFPAMALIAGLFTVFLDLPRVGIGDLTIADVLLCAGVIGSLRSPYSPSIIRFIARQRALVAGFSMLFLGCLLGAAVGVSNGANLGRVIADARPLLFLGALFLAATLTLTSGIRAMVIGGVGLTFATGALSLTQAVVGPNQPLYVADDPYKELLTCSSGTCPPPQLADSFLRIRPPGLLLAFVAVIFALSYLFWSSRRYLFLSLLTLCFGSIAIALSLNRNMLFSTILGLLLVGLLISRKHRSTVMICAIVFAATVILSNGTNEFVSSPVLSRFASGLSISHARTDPSIKDREKESAAAVDRLSQQPLLGVGWGVPYGVQDPISGGPKLWIHNQYLGLLLKTGIFGFIGWLLCVLGCIRLAIGSARSSGGSLRWLGAGTAASIIALSASSLVAIYIFDIRGMTAYSLLFGISVALGMRREGEPGARRG